MPQLEFRNIKKIYDQNETALDGVSFSIEPGEFVFLVGPSGAGKSTLVKLLIREESPTEGDILFEDKSILEIPRKELPSLRRRIGVVFQDFKVLPSKNVFENVAVALDVVNSPADVIREVVPNVLNLVGLQDKINRFPKQLSGGEKQRLAIARALAHEPDILVADEPTGMIDPSSTDEVIAVLDKINSLGTTIFMSTHDQSVVDKMQKRVVKLENGKIVSDRSGGYNE